MSQLSDRINDDVSDPKSVTVVIFLPWIATTFRRISRYWIKIQNCSSASLVNVIKKYFLTDNNGEQYTGTKYQFFYVLFMDIKNQYIAHAAKK